MSSIQQGPDIGKWLTDTQNLANEKPRNYSTNEKIFMAIAAAITIFCYPLIAALGSAICASYKFKKSYNAYQETKAVDEMTKDRDLPHLKKLTTARKNIAVHQMKQYGTMTAATVLFTLAILLNMLGPSSLTPLNEILEFSGAGLIILAVLYAEKDSREDYITLITPTLFEQARLECNIPAPSYFSAFTDTVSGCVNAGSNLIKRFL